MILRHNKGYNLRNRNGQRKNVRRDSFKHFLKSQPQNVSSFNNYTGKNKIYQRNLILSECDTLKNNSVAAIIDNQELTCAKQLVAQRESSNKEGFKFPRVFFVNIQRKYNSVSSAFIKKAEDLNIFLYLEKSFGDFIEFFTFELDQSNSSDDLPFLGLVWYDGMCGLEKNYKPDFCPQIQTSPKDDISKIINFDLMCPNSKLYLNLDFSRMNRRTKYNTLTLLEKFNQDFMFNYINLKFFDYQVYNDTKSRLVFCQYHFDDFFKIIKI